jgi:flavin-dependent dehydrogenase
VQFADELFTIKSSAETITAKVAAGAYGKNSNIDAQLGRKYKAPTENDLFIGVKHHIRTDFDQTVVEMHSFPGGYCGMSAIEDGKVNMSYISKAANLKTAGSIPAMEEQVLSGNPFLRKYFENSTFLFDRPVTISHIYFQVKAPVADGIVMTGDAAGSIAPASGNGMSMALKSSLLAGRAIGTFLTGGISRDAMLQQYAGDYYQAFTERIKVSKQINSMLTRPGIANMAFRLFRLFPWIIDLPSKRMHGDPF